MVTSQKLFPAAIESSLCVSVYVTYNRVVCSPVSCFIFCQLNSTWLGIYVCFFFHLQLIDFWTPNKLIDIDGTEKEWLPPKGKYATNYGNSEAMRYEAEAVRQSIIAGDVENKNVSYADSLLFAEIEDTIRRQIGVLNKFDEE